MMNRIAALLLIIAFVAIKLISQGIISYEQPLISKAADWYGAYVSKRVAVEIIRPGAIRPGIFSPDDQYLPDGSKWQSIGWATLYQQEIDADKLLVVAVTPDAENYDQLINKCVEQRARLVVESSGIDAWHTTSAGYKGLKQLTEQALRAVVFDGGHHLPTLGLTPDLIIVPVTQGYAAHAYMRDAVKVEKLLALMEQEHIDCPVAAVSRWGLVKTPSSMNQIAMEALRQLPPASIAIDQKGAVLAPRLTMRGKAAFMYESVADEKSLQMVRKKLVEHGAERLYIAFNYSLVTDEDADGFIKGLEHYGLQVMLMNEPRNLVGAIVGGTFDVQRDRGFSIKSI
ncbi:MAG: hypothetical protein GXY50_03280 [Syntrophomonadaceae bacterium]|nr:hypothetical protein [Syntrophomonadaceae bacterium]